MSDDNSVQWIKKEIIPHILLNLDLRGSTITKTEVHEMDGMKDNWASTMFEIKLLTEHHGSIKTISFLLKVMNADKKIRETMQSHKQFFNEIHFYSTVMSLFTSEIPIQFKCEFQKLFPKFFLSCINRNKKPETYRDAFLVIDNLKVRDFKLGNRTSLDFEHCSLALKSLGVFHAFSYYMKGCDADKFMKKVVHPIQETNYDPTDRDTWNTIFGVCVQRVVDGLAAEVSGDDFRLARLRERASRNPFDVFISHVQPDEPMSVLCHGDFLRNNVLFRYDNNEPVEMNFIDFQTIRYSTPAVDVSLLLCMNTTHELRAAHFDELLQVYHTSLTNTLAGILGKSKDQLDQCFSFESFLADFRLHAEYGYMITIEFLPWMYADEEELETFVKVYWEERGSPRHQELAKVLGGERATRALVDLAKDLIDSKCL